MLDFLWSELRISEILGQKQVVDIILKKYNLMKQSIFSEKGIDDIGGMVRKLSTSELIRNTVALTMGKECV